MLTWKEALQQARYRNLLIYIIVFAILFFAFIPSYFQFIESKQGRLLNDPLLNLLPAFDLSIPIFFLIYSIVLSTAIVNIRKPHTILMIMGTYCSVNFLRLISMFMFTLEPPTGWVMLHDPIVSLIAYEPAFAKDLFFSGHIATLMVTLLPEPNRVFKRIKIAVTIIVGVLLLIQHIHYTIDVIAAPVFTYLSYKVMQRLMK